MLEESVQANRRIVSSVFAQSNLEKGGGAKNMREPSYKGCTRARIGRERRIKSVMNGYMEGRRKM